MYISKRESNKAYEYVVKKFIVFIFLTTVIIICEPFFSKIYIINYVCKLKFENDKQVKRDRFKKKNYAASNFYNFVNDSSTATINFLYMQ